MLLQSRHTFCIYFICTTCRPFNYLGWLQILPMLGILSPWFTILCVWQNLKPCVKDKCSIDPLAGKYQATFEALADHTVMYDSQTFDNSASPFWGKPRSNHVAALKGASSHAALQNHSKKPHGKCATSSDGGRPPKRCFSPSRLLSSPGRG